MNARKSVLGAAVMLGALVAFAGLPAGVARAGTGIKVPCSGPGGGAAGLAAAITAANAAGGGTIALAPGCTYTLTAAGSSGPLGANGLPIVSTRITIAGAHATIARSSSQQFRILEVDGPGGNLAISGLTLTGGAGCGRLRAVRAVISRTARTRLRRKVSRWWCRSLAGRSVLHPRRPAQPRNRQGLRAPRPRTAWWRPGMRRAARRLRRLRAASG